MTKIIPVLQGGLGNQLFIYAAARRLAAKTNSELILDHKSGFSRDHRYRRSYALRQFLPNAKLVSPSQRIDSMGGLRKKMMRVGNFLRPNKLGQLIVEDRPEFQSSILRLSPKNKLLYMEGYWQSANYFLDIESVIRSDLSEKAVLDAANNYLSEMMRDQNSTAIHVRVFGDSAQEYSEMQKYYRRAIQYVESKCPNSFFYIFGENSDAVKNLVNVPAERSRIISHNVGECGPYVDLFLMRQCKNIIIAKSTFSWWGAWLSERKGKLVVAPKGEKTEGESLWGFAGLLPDEWVKL